MTLMTTTSVASCQRLLADLCRLIDSERVRARERERETESERDEDNCQVLRAVSLNMQSWMVVTRKKGASSAAGGRKKDAKRYMQLINDCDWEPTNNKQQQHRDNGRIDGVDCEFSSNSRWRWRGSISDISNISHSNCIFLSLSFLFSGSVLVWFDLSAALH